jgi:uncharacterized lipoprotein YajG
MAGEALGTYLTNRAVSRLKIGDMTMSAIKIILALALLAGATATAFANAPGGAYTQCDPNNKSSPVRCTPDGW